MTKRENFSSGSRFEADFGYSRAVRVGETVYVAGCTGYDYGAGTISEDPVAQFEQLVVNIEAALALAGARLDEVVQITLYVTSKEVMDAIGPSLKDTFGPIGPTNTALVVAFPIEGIKVEITVTAVLGATNRSASRTG